MHLQDVFAHPGHGVTSINGSTCINEKLCEINKAFLWQVQGTACNVDASCEYSE
jgi:hypothetical protein